MAGATVTGLAEARRAVANLPNRVTDAMRKVAEATAERAKQRAQALVPVDTGVTRDSIVVIAQVEEKQYVVEVGPAPAGREGRTATLPNLPVWIEYGTIHQAPRPFMRPAREAESGRYVRDMTAAVEQVAKETFD